jgi:hypothetical protein
MRIEPIYTWKKSALPRHIESIAAKSAYLFELEFDWLRVHGCNSIGDVVPDLERLILGSAREGDKERVCVAVYYSGVPFRPRVDKLLSLMLSETSLRAKGLTLTFSKVSRPVCTIESATSMQGIRPE